MALFRRLMALALVGYPLIGCQMTLEIPPGATVSCASNADCPSGNRCNVSTGLCVATERTDLEAPVVQAADLSRAIVGLDGPGYDETTLTLVVNEALAGTPRVYFTDLGVERSFSAFSLVESRDDGAQVYEASYAPTGEETQTTFPLQTVLEDELGNRFVGVLPSTLSFDFVAPELLTVPSDLEPVVSLMPDIVDNPLAREVATLTHIANRTTRVLITFSVTESVAPPVLRTVPQSDATFDVFSRAGNTWTFELDWAATTDSFGGAYEVVAALLDDAGNPAEITLTGADLRLDTEMPARAAVDVERALRLVRAPWGRADSHGEPVFALEGEASAVEGDAWVLVYRDAAGVREIGRVRANEHGAFGGPDGTPPFELATADVERVYVRVADDAGNLTQESELGAATAVRDARWIVNAGGKVAGDLLSNPHRVFRTPYLAPFAQQGGFTEIGGAGIGVLDGATTAVRGGGSWWQLDMRTAGLPGRMGHGMAWDSSSGTTYIAGGLRGFGNGPVIQCQGSPSPTFEFVERGFEDRWHAPSVSVMSLSPREGRARLVFDGTRNVLMMLSNGAQWTFKDEIWTQECLFGGCGASVSGGPLVYDPARRAVVQVDVGGAVRLWDGASWTLACDGGVCPGAQPTGGVAAAVFDENLQETLVFGLGDSHQETWSFDGTRWLERCTSDACLASRPAARSEAAMAFDRASGEAVLFGGNPTSGACSSGWILFAPPEAGVPSPAFDDTWTFDGELWTQHTPAASPAPRYGHAMVYDGMRQRVVLQGGTFCDCFGYAEHPSMYSDAWAWDGNDWTQETTPSLGGIWMPATPPGSSRHAMTTDPVSQRVVMTSGALGGALYTSVGGRWFSGGGGMSVLDAPLASRSPLGASSPVGPSIFGGSDGDGITPAPPYTFTFTGDAFTPACGDDPCIDVTPPQRYRHATSTDGTDLLMFGGTFWYPESSGGGPPSGGTYDGAMADTWRLGPTGWTQLCTSAPCSDLTPGARGGHAMAFTGASGEVLMFGGAQNVGGALDDTWLWQNDHWTSATSSEVPEARIGHTMLLDPARDIVLLYGGTDDPGSAYAGDPVSGYHPDAAQHVIPPGYEAVWEWQAGAWRAMDSVTPRLTDSSPNRRYYHGAAWDPSLGGMLVYGGVEPPSIDLYGIGGTGGSSATWLWRPEVNGRPALVLRANVKAGGAAVQEHLTSIELTWYGTATSFAGDELVAGVAFGLWDGLGWHSVATTSCGDTCRRFDSRDDVRPTRAFVAGTELPIAVLPAAGNGEDIERAHVETDYLEASFWYRL